MTINEEVQAAIKEGKAILGMRESIKEMKSGKPKVVIVSDNMPKSSFEEVSHNVKSLGLKMETFNGSSKDLGTICGKPFPVSVLVIKG